MAGRGGPIVLAAAALVAAAIPAVPYLTGLRAEAHFTHWVERLRASPAVEVHAVRYERHWGRARAHTDVTLHLPRRRLRIAVDHVIEHGPRPDLPALARITSVPEVPEPLQPLAARVFVDRPPLKAVTTLRFDGGQQVAIRSPPFEATLQAEGTIRVRWQGMRLELRAEDDRLHLDGHTPGLAIAKGQTELRLEGVNLNTRLDRRGGAWLGDNTLTVARIATAGRWGITLDGLRLQQRAEQARPDLLRFTSALDLDAVTPETGPAYRRLGFTLTLDRIDRAAYRGLARIAAERRRAESEGGLRPGPGNRRLAALAGRFLARSPRVALERLTAFGPHGTAEASASLRFRGGPDLDLAAGPGLLRRLAFEGRVRLPKGMLEAVIAAGLRHETPRQETDRYALPPDEQDARVEAATQRRLRTFEQAGFIEADGGAYVARARLADGRLTLNGRPLPLGTDTVPVPGR